MTGVQTCALPISGAPLLVLHADDPSRFDRALAALDGAIEVADTPVAPPPLLIDRVP